MAKKETAKKTKQTKAKGEKANKVAKIRRQKKLLEALVKTNGIICPACEMAGIDRKTFYIWKKQDEEFAKQVEDITERQIDIVESKLLQNINNGDTTSIIFYLKTKGRNRGYSERIELTGKDGEDLIKSKDDSELEARIKELEEKFNN